MAESVITEPEASHRSQHESVAPTSPNGEEVPLNQLNAALDRLWESLRGLDEALERVEARMDKILLIFEKAG